MTTRPRRRQRAIAPEIEPPERVRFMCALLFICIGRPTYEYMIFWPFMNKICTKQNKITKLRFRIWSHSLYQNYLTHKQENVFSKLNNWLWPQLKQLVGLGSELIKFFSFRPRSSPSCSYRDADHWQIVSVLIASTLFLLSVVGPRGSQACGLALEQVIKALSLFLARGLTAGWRTVWRIVESGQLTHCPLTRCEWIPHARHPPLYVTKEVISQAFRNDFCFNSNNNQYRTIISLVSVDNINLMDKKS